MMNIFHKCVCFSADINCKCRTLNTQNASPYVHQSLNRAQIKMYHRRHCKKWRKRREHAIIFFEIVLCFTYVNVWRTLIGKIVQLCSFTAIQNTHIIFDYFSVLQKCGLEPYETALRKQDVSMEIVKIRLVHCKIVLYPHRTGLSPCQTVKIWRVQRRGEVRQRERPKR